MSDTPTYANLITRLFSGSANDRAAVVAHLCAHPADAHAVEAAIRDQLRSKLGWPRLVAADAVLRVYGDARAVVPSVEAVLRAGGGVAWSSADAFTLLRSVGGNVARLGGAGAWKKLLDASPVEATPALLIALAKAAPDADRDFSHLAPAVREFLASPSLRVVAGAALWRVTWRVNREWLAAINPTSEGLAQPGLRPLVLDVLIEHLGRRPDLAPLIRDIVAGFSGEAGGVPVAQLARLGSRGWGVLVPMLSAGGGVPVPVAVRRAILTEAAKRPAVLPLVHHHAHAVVASAAAEGKTNDLVPPAAEVLANLGPAADTALPDLLNIAVRAPHAAPDVAAAVRAVAPGFPNAAGAVVRALHRLRTAAYYGTDHATAFGELAGVLAELDADAAPALVENTDIDPRVPDLLLQHAGWKEAAAEVRTRHAKTLANSVGSPRAEVRLRAAELLRHYRDELPAVWPALVAVLAGSDEKTAVAVLPHFRHLGAVADVVSPELQSLFRETNPAYAARAVVALWRLGRFPEIAVALRAAVEASAEDGWGWAVLRGVVARVASAHMLIAELSEVFAAAPAAVAEKVAAILNAPESPEETHITACLPPPGTPGAVNWDELYKVVESDGAVGAMLFVALMCEYGSAGFHNQKIWMIKGQRELARVGLTESKAAVEGVISTLAGPGAPAADRRAAVRSFFCGRTELPPEVVKLLEHRLGWFRWAGLELADGWGLTTDKARALTEDRVWDTNPRVRERALRMVRG